MNRALRNAVLASVLLLGLTGMVLLLTMAVLRPPAGDLVALASFLLISGGVTVALGLGASRLGLLRWVRSLWLKLVLVSVLTALLALANVGFTAMLMFLSTHDLALLAGLLGFSIGMSVFVAFAFSEPTVRSLRALVGAARHMSAGELDARVKVESRDETGELAEAFNSMAEQLEARFARERELEQARKELISAVSHDLRTPLASIRAMVESMQDGVVTDPDTVKRYMRTTLTEVENLSQLVNDLFELSHMDAGVLELHMEAASLQDLVSDTLESMSPSGGGPGAEPARVGGRGPHARGHGYPKGPASPLQPGAKLHTAHAAGRDDLYPRPGRRQGGEGGGCRHGRGDPCAGARPVVRALIPPRPVALARVGGRWPGTEHRQGYRRGPRRSDLGRERGRKRKHLYLHAAQGACPGPIGDCLAAHCSKVSAESSGSYPSTCRGCSRSR